MDYYRSRYQGRASLRDPKAEALKAETPQADRLKERLEHLRQNTQTIQS
jgi:hypothetical protein